MYDHYIALDWAQSNMAIARMTRQSSDIAVVEVPSSVKELKGYLRRLKGRSILTFEETTTSQWLFTELKSSVDEILVCDPYRNKLLSEGAKTDRIDARKLVTLLRAELLKPVFHSSDNFISYRKLTSGYKDLVTAGVRLKNQRAALFRAIGMDRRSETIVGESENFVLKGLDEAIELYGQRKSLYEKEFSRICKGHAIAKNLETIPGIGTISAVKIAAIVVNAERFATKNHFLSYCGLVKHELLSGGRSYGRRASRYCRDLKSVFKIGALACIAPNSKSPLKAYYLFLIQEKRYAEHNARHAVARRLALIVYGVLKSGRRFDPKRIKTT
jgi:transposase